MKRAHLLRRHRRPPAQRTASTPRGRPPMAPRIWTLLIARRRVRHSN